MTQPRTNIRAAKVLMELAEKREVSRRGYRDQESQPWQAGRDRAVRLTGQKSPHFTRSGPGRIHNHSGTEKQFWKFEYYQFVRRFTVKTEYAIRLRLNRFTKMFDKVDLSRSEEPRFRQFLNAVTKAFKNTASYG